MEARFGHPTDRRESLRLSPLEDDFPGPGQIINHHRMRQFRGIYGANHVWGTTAAHNNPLAFAPPPGRSPPTDLSSQNSRSPSKARNSKTRVKRALLQILAQNHHFYTDKYNGTRSNSILKLAANAISKHSSPLTPNRIRELIKQSHWHVKQEAITK